MSGLAMLAPPHRPRPLSGGAPLKNYIAKYAPEVGVFTDLNLPSRLDGARIGPDDPGWVDSAGAGLSVIRVW